MEMVIQIIKVSEIPYKIDGSKDDLKSEILNVPSAHFSKNSSSVDE